MSRALLQFFRFFFGNRNPGERNTGILSYFKKAAAFPRFMQSERDSSKSIRIFRNRVPTAYVFYSANPCIIMATTALEAGSRGVRRIPSET